MLKKLNIHRLLQSGKHQYVPNNERISEEVINEGNIYQAIKYYNASIE